MTSMIPDKLYDILKWVALVGLPAVGTLYWSLSLIWGFPYSGEIVRSIVAVEFFLGSLLGISSAQYYKSEARRAIQE